MADEYLKAKQEKPEIKSEYADIGLGEQEDRSRLIDEVYGLIPVGSSAPTHKPRKFVEQFRIVGALLYFYNPVADTWTSLGADTVYGGVVASNGTAGTPFPSGWTSQATATGIYVITHNLGHSNYAVVAWAYSTAVRAVNLSNKGTTAFTVTVKDSGGTDTANAFEFILTDEN